MGVSCFKSDARLVIPQGLHYDSVDLLRFDLFLSLLFILKNNRKWWWVKGIFDKNQTSGDWKVVPCGLSIRRAGPEDKS